MGAGHRLRDGDRLARAAGRLELLAEPRPGHAQAGLLPEPPGLGRRIPHPADRLLPGCCRDHPASHAGPAARPPAYTGYGYEVFLIDAATGGDALIYDQTQPVPCGGTGVVPAGVAVPIEETSVPWTLDRRDPDRFAAVLTAFVPPCDFHDSVTGVIPGTALVRVLAYGPVAARCGRPRPVTVDLEAASVTQNLPPVLVRAPAGLYLPGTGNTTPGQSSGPPTGPSSRSTAARRSLCTSVTCWPPGPVPR
jgi:hypothetical protein